MEEKIIKQFWKLINRFETTLYALKWHQENKDYYWSYDCIISEYEIALKNLKENCINYIGCIDDYTN